MEQADESTVWVWRSGRAEERDSWSIKTGLVGGGWDWLPSLESVGSRDEIRQVYKQARPPEAEQGEAKHVGELYSIRFAVSIGDIVVMPRTRRKQVAFGRVVETYRYQENEPDPTRRHVAQVDWLRTTVERDDLADDLLRLLGLRGTIYRPNAQQAQSRLRSIADGLPDPGLVEEEAGATVRAFVLTWNPNLVPPTSDWHTSGRWSSRSRKPRVGDEVYLLRQRKDRGIVRKGTVCEAAFMAPHWDPKKAAAGEETAYLGIDWATDLLLPPPLSVGLLEDQIPDYAWNHQYSSGNELPAPIAERVAHLWGSSLPATTAAQSAWNIEPGSIVTRSEIHERFGGALYGGIQPSAQTPNIFVYSDPETSADIYPYDGWSDDQSVFLYTGEGRQGDQRLINGNKAILNHKSDGRILRVFAADGRLEGTNTRTHVYLGAFEVDAELPYVLQPAPDSDGEERSVIVFRLRPIGQTVSRAEDRSQTGDVASAAESILVDIEANVGSEYTIPSTAERTGTRREGDLVERFIESHPSGKGSFKRFKVRPKGELAYLYTDVFDTVTSTLFEAKAHATRNAVREAIGQLLDYRRHIEPAPRSLAVLLPSRPTDDLLNLITSLQMLCVFETDAGEFATIPSGG